MLAAGRRADSIHAANRALFEHLAAEPAFARVAAVEVLAAGSAALERRDRAIQLFVGPRVQAGAGGAAGLGGGDLLAVYSLIYRQVIRYGPQALPRLGAKATFIDLAPVLGAKRAAEVASRPAARVA